jgi:hypothetical protein
VKIAIDLNDVIRDFSPNFLKYYIEGYNHEFDLSEFEFWSNDMRHVFPFTSDESYYNFMYNDYAFELFGKCNTCSRKTTQEFNDWCEKTVPELDLDVDIDLIVVSAKEYGLSIGNTYYFLSKLGTKIRETYFPVNSFDIWDKCDILITANPDLINSKPEGKVVIKINTEYNKDIECEYNFPSFSSLVENTEKFVEIIKNKMNN